MIIEEINADNLLDFLKNAELALDGLSEEYAKKGKIRAERNAYSAAAYINMLIKDLEEEVIGYE